MDVFYGVHGVRRGKGEGERVGGLEEEGEGGEGEGGRGRREEYYHTVQVAEGSSKKSSMPDVTIS